MAQIRQKRYRDYLIRTGQEVPDDLADPQRPPSPPEEAVAAPPADPPPPYEAVAAPPPVRMRGYLPGDDLVGLPFPEIEPPHANVNELGEPIALPGESWRN